MRDGKPAFAGHDVEVTKFYLLFLFFCVILYPKKATKQNAKMSAKNMIMMTLLASIFHPPLRQHGVWFYFHYTMRPKDCQVKRL